MTKPDRVHRKTLVIVGILLYAGFMVIRIPAALVWHWLPLPDTMQHQSVTGTIWNGEIHDVAWESFILNRVQWSFKPSYLLRAMPAIEWSIMNSDGVRASGIAGWRWGWHLSKIEARLPAEQLQHAFWPISTANVSIAGILNVAIETLDIADNQCDGHGQITLNPGQIQMDNASLQVNDAVLRFDCQDNQLNWSLSQHAAELVTSLQGTFDLQGNYRISGELQPSAALPASFAAVLPWLGIKNKKNNYYYIDKHGRWNARSSPH